MLHADIPALLRKGATEAPGGQLDVSRGSLVFRKQGVAIPLRVDMMEHSFLSVVDFDKDPSRRLPSPVASASFFEIVQKAPDLSNGGLPFPYAENHRSPFRLARRLQSGFGRIVALRAPRRLS